MTVAKNACAAASAPNQTKSGSYRREDGRARKAEQNRLAQKAFRERKDLRIKDLEMRVVLLTQALTKAQPCSSLEGHADALVKRITQLEMQISLLLAENETLRTLTTYQTNGPPPEGQFSSSHWASDILSAMNHRSPPSDTSSDVSLSTFPASPNSALCSSPVFDDSMGGTHNIQEMPQKRSRFMDTVI
ncbi:hypothetical protein BJ741DRAFT_603963 [Chytriomyces cf. hyalinus JEL632]|nr:hypothetical protein BJ741DRAFT_603963 [Chytriomyces cf. hyalinus JEL632]